MSYQIRGQKDEETNYSKTILFSQFFYFFPILICVSPVSVFNLLSIRRLYQNIQRKSIPLQIPHILAMHGLSSKGPFKQDLSNPPISFKKVTQDLNRGR